MTSIRTSSRYTGVEVVGKLLYFEGRIKRHPEVWGGSMDFFLSNFRDVWAVWGTIKGTRVQKWEKKGNGFGGKENGG